MRRRQWNIGLARVPISRFLEDGIRAPIEWLPVTHRDEFFADPFGLVYNGKLRVLFERFDRRKGEGAIWTFQWPERGNPAEAKPALQLPGHASYPYIVEHAGQVYCIPETSQAGEVALFVADPFPIRWKKVATLLDGFPGVDNTLFRYEARWWLSCTRSNQPEMLYLWYSDDLEGPWRGHEKNPVENSPPSARPGGTPFVSQGVLYRPAQDCEEGYGKRIVINAVSDLTPRTFREAVVAVVEPDPAGPYPLGLHTLSSVGDMTLLDGLRDRFSGRGFRRGGAHS